MIAGEKGYSKEVSKAFKETIGHMNNMDHAFEYIRVLNEDEHLVKGERIEKLDKKLGELGLKFAERINIIENVKHKIKD